MRKFLLILLTTLVISGSMLVPCYAWEPWDPETDEGDYDYAMAYTVEHACWTMDTGYDRPTYITLTDYYTYGQPITITPQSDGTAYPECANLDDVDLVARVIYAEICNLTDISDNAYAVAQVIKTRMGSKKTARQVVTEKYQFSSVHDGNTRFADTSLDDDPDTWAKCTWLAACLVAKDSIPLETTMGQETATDIGSRTNFYDISGDIPFYTSSKVKCTSRNIESEAYYYKAGSKYYKITKSPIKIGNHVYYSY